MKNLNILSGATLAILVALVLVPLSTLAQINVGTDVSGDLEVNTNSDNSTSSDNGILEINLNADATSTTDADSDGSLLINNEGVAVTIASEVQSDADLEIFAENFPTQEEQVEEVSFDSETTGAWETRVVYKHEGKLFGLMPVTVKSTTVVEVDEEGQLEVDSSLPWWNFMVTEKNHAEAEIESRIRDNATVMAAAEVEANATVKAQVVEAIVAELNAHTYIHAAINMN